MSGKEAQLTQLLQPTVEAMGYVLWGIELISTGKRSTLRPVSYTHLTLPTNREV